MHLDRLATEKAEQHATKLTKRHLVKPCWILIVPFLFPSTLAAEPSLAETVQYLEVKLSNASLTTDTITFRLNGGKITYTITYTGYDQDGWREVSSFQLGALSTAVDVDPGLINDEVRISCARGKCISYRLFDDDGDERRRGTTGGMSFMAHKIDSEKIQKALTHAIRISGGKDELF